MLTAFCLLFQFVDLLFEVATITAPMDITKTPTTVRLASVKEKIINQLPAVPFATFPVQMDTLRMQEAVQCAGASETNLYPSNKWMMSFQTISNHVGEDQNLTP